MSRYAAETHLAGNTGRGFSLVKYGILRASVAVTRREGSRVSSACATSRAAGDMSLCAKVKRGGRDDGMSIGRVSVWMRSTTHSLYLSLKRWSQLASPSPSSLPPSPPSSRLTSSFGRMSSNHGRVSTPFHLSSFNGPMTSTMVLS